jgi:hypothetical protein
MPMSKRDRIWPNFPPGRGAWLHVEAGPPHWPMTSSCRRSWRFSIRQGPDDDRIVAIRIWNAILGGMEGTEYRVMLSGSDRYYVELTRQGASSCTTSDFATQSAAQDWIDQDREREGASDRRWQVASRRWPGWMHLWWRA